MRQEFYFPSADGENRIHGYWWRPDGQVKAVLQMVHGMTEHIGRYDRFANYLTHYGFAVIGHDHLGHGESVQSPEDYGFFAQKNGKVALLKDMHHVTRKARDQYPDVPLFILGHSMGSFFLRRYITLWGDEIDGAIIMGTGHVPLSLARFGKGLCALMQKKKGPKHRSRILHRITLGSYQAKFGKNPKRPGSWLTRDNEIAREYAKDEKSGFVFTTSAYGDFFSLMIDLAKEKDANRIPKDLPLILVSGMDDPVGGFAKGVLEVYNHLVSLGMEDVDIRLYKEDRHEILNELDRDEVYGDLCAWMVEHAEAK